MRLIRFVSAIVCCALGVQAAVSAQGTMTLAEALERARTRAPYLLAARARVEEARARLIGASVKFRDNPLVDVDAGPRLRPGSSGMDFPSAPRCGKPAWAASARS